MNITDAREIDRLTVRTDRLEFEPVRDLIIIEELDDPLVTGGGLHIPGKLKKTKFSRNRVLAVGPGIYQNGVLIPCCVRPGDIVTMASCEAQEIPGRQLPTYIVSDQAVTSIIHEKGEGN